MFCKQAHGAKVRSTTELLVRLEVLFLTGMNSDAASDFPFVVLWISTSPLPLK